MKKLVSCLITVLLVMALSGHEVYNINRNWKFFTYNENASLNINLPHMWNNDALSGRADYYRGIGNYLRYIDTKAEWAGKRVYIKFYGANLVTDLLIDGKYVGQHKGGCNAFVFDITDFITCGESALFWVIVNNTQTINTLPTAGADNSYGGIFRDVEIIVAGPTSFAINDGSTGVSIETDAVTSEKVSGKVNTLFIAPKGVQVTAKVAIKDMDGKTVATAQNRAKSTGSVNRIYIPFEVSAPTLWNGRSNPYMYDFDVELITDTLQDEQTVSTGFRSLSVEKDGIRLNGNRYPLKGVVIHRDRATSGSAMSESETEDDIKTLMEMGANAVRVAGGSHNRHFYDLCDRNGILVITDLPFIGATVLNNKGFFNTADFRTNGTEQLQEMILQLGNHPSIIAWNLFSEIELRGEDPSAYVRELNSVAKKMDPSRFTSGVSNQDGDINFVTDLITWSHTFGWQEGLPEDIALWQEQLHATPEWADLRSAVGYKCGGVISHVADTLQKPILASNWHPENWQTHFNEVYFSNMSADSLLWGTFVDALFDYGSVLYTHGEGLGINDTGLVSFDRKNHKDAFYLYKANWNTEDLFVHITDKRRQHRSKPEQLIKVYSNMPEVELFVNGVSQGTRQGTNGIFLWDNVMLGDGNNVVSAVSGDCADSATINVSSNFSTEL